MASKDDNLFSYALIGCGRVSVKHIKAVLKKNSPYRFVAIADTDPSAPSRLFTAVGLPRRETDNLQKNIHFYTDYQELLETEKPDVTAITTPSGLHCAMAAAAMKVGSHILLEKPMAMSSLEVRELCNISRSTGREIAMGHIYRYFPIVGLIREDIRKGIFGEISHGSVQVRWGHDQAYYDQAVWRGSWKSDGGALMNQSIHALDLMCWLMDSPALSASATIAQRYHKMEAEDVGLGFLELQSGALCQIEGTTNTSTLRHEASFHITGSRGSISLGLRSGRPFFDIRDERGKSKNKHYFARQLKLSGWKSIPDFFNPHIGIYDDLAESIRNNRRPIADALSGCTSVEMVLALYKSAKEGKKISLPLREDFSAEEMTGFFCP